MLTVDEEECYKGEDNEESVLDSSADQVDIAREIGHVEDVGQVIGHDIGSRQLLPCLNGESRESATPHA